MNAKLGLVVVSMLVAGPGCGEKKSDAEAFVDGYCDEVAKCCAMGGLSTDGELCRTSWASAALAGAYSAQAGKACLAEVRAEVGAGSFCQTVQQAPPVACSAVYGGGDASRQPGESCKSVGDCAPSNDGEVICASANISGTFVNKCQVLVSGKAGDMPCSGTQDGSTFQPYTDTAAIDVPAQAYVCNLSDGIQCRLGTCSALVAIGEHCGLSSDCVRNAFCNPDTQLCATRVAAGSTCKGGDTSECVDGHYCQSSTKQCAAKESIGGSCSVSSMCKSDYCLNNSCAEDYGGLKHLCGT